MTMNQVKTMTARVATFVDLDDGPIMRFVTDEGELVIKLSPGQAANIFDRSSDYLLRRFRHHGNVASNLEAAIHMESAAISPQTSPLMEISREAVALLRGVR